MITKEQQEELMGKTVKGFRFENGYGQVGFLPGMMDKFVGIEGRIRTYYKGLGIISSYYKGLDGDKEYDCFHIDFGTDTYSYPADLVYEQYLSETRTEDEIYGDIYSLLRSIK